MISIKTDNEILILREGGAILGDILRKLECCVEPGVSTMYLEDLACKLIAKMGGIPSFKNYQPGGKGKPFPTALCTSINQEVVHAPAIPSRKLKSGDIIGIDVGMKYRGLFTDTAITVGVGSVGNDAKKLLRVTKNALFKGINQIRPGNHLSEVSRAVQDHVEGYGYSVVRDLVGHGVGYKVHEEPQIFNYINKEVLNNDIILKKGMVLALEPMVNIGGYEVDTLRDGFSVITRDGSLAAQFEHTIAVTENSFLIITK